MIVVVEVVMVDGNACVLVLHVHAVDVVGVTGCGEGGFGAISSVFCCWKEFSCQVQRMAGC